MINIREFNPQDYPKVQAIYQEGIDFGFATFQTEVKSWQEWDDAMISVCRLVAEMEGQLVGWAALSAISNRPVYRGVAEVSIYVTQEARGQGVGHALLKNLVSQSEALGFWTLQSGIFPENQASIALHRRNSFRILGVRKKLGQLNGEWRDVVFMERRSAVTGL
ncbi:phosphinothricin acetyltransferase [Shewanella mangrovi]|uniref:Phosphinothricin acetyltransferase n=1 Tax=Shewanella mangrovi TaxID=1515746 RepID=A0A094JX59_9GAMM|nr:GNAT family N-acetyltransferase [Shewanella mangrovi]KFZ37011.1 phosphinothricin acetyltransferase [Shewanella mangrovi]